MRNQTREKGLSAERVAENFYLRDGYALVERNFRSRGGEIDLILWRDPELLVVEVKGRRRVWNDEAWAPRWRGKKLKILRTLHFFLSRKSPYYDLAEEIRFEIVFVTQGRVRERWMDEGFF